MNEKTEWIRFKNHVNEKLPSVTENVFRQTASYFDVLNDFLNILIFLQRIDPFISETKLQFYADLKNNLSRAAIYFYLNDAYLNNIIFRAMIESVYRLLFSYYHTNKISHSIYKMSRFSMSKTFGADLKKFFPETSKVLDLQKSVDGLYSDYSGYLHGRNEESNDKLYIISNIGEKGEFNSLISDYNVIIDFTMIPILDILKGINVEVANRIFSEEKISRSKRDILNRYGNLNLP